MGTLFVCKWNVGRSQMAEAMYKKIYNKDCFSAWTVVWENEWVKIKDIPEANNVITVLLEEWIDISNNTRKQLTEGLCKQADRIIIMAEVETIPEYLKQYKNIIYRDVENPKWLDYAGHKRVLHKIKDLLLTLQ